MPPTRSDVRESRRKRLLNTRPVPSNRPDWDAEWLDKIIPASELGMPFKHLYDSEGVGEVEFNTTTIPTPTDPRPPPLTLDNLECLKTLGESHCKVLLVRSTRKSHNLDSEYLFALKAIPRKHIRENAVSLALETAAAKANGKEITQSQKSNFLKSHKREKESEIGTLANLDWHPFITGLINTFHDSQNLYLGLEYAPHGTLRSLLQQSSQTGMNPRDANFYFANILAAVDFLHIQGFVHRDVKPENILLNSDGYLCLTDFGSACSIGEDLPKSGGTYAYMAPEWYETHLDPRLLDWWSCGCILFEMATGKAFFNKETLFDLTWPPDARVGNHLKDLIKRLLDADPTNRLGHNGASDIAKHPWLSTTIDWEKMLGRHYLPPFIPKPVKVMELWHKCPLPEQRVVPGLTIVQPGIHLENDDRFPK